MVYILELKRIFKPIYTGFNLKARMLMFIEMERMLEAGISIYNTFSHLIEQTTNREKRMVLTKMMQLVEAGSTISAGMACFPEYFTEDDVRLMEVGEEIGKIDKACKIIWQKYEKQLEIRGKVILAAWYPALISILVPLIIPIKYLVLEGLDAYLKKSVFPLIFVITGIIASYIAFRLFRVTPGIRETIDNIMLHLPFFGKINQKFAIARFASTFSMLYSGGIRLDENLALSARVSRNSILEKDIHKIIPPIMEEGQSLTSQLNRIGHFPPAVIELFSVGEETGKLDETLQKVSQYSLSEADQSLQKFLRVLPVFLFLMVAVVVCYVVVSMYLEIYSGIFEKARAISPH